MSRVTAGVNGLRTEPLERSEVRAAMAPLADLLGVDLSTVRELHVTGSTVRARVTPKNRRGKLVPGAVVTLSVKVVED